MKHDTIRKFLDLNPGLNIHFCGACKKEDLPRYPNIGDIYIILDTDAIVIRNYSHKWTVLHDKPEEEIVIGE